MLTSASFFFHFAQENYIPKHVIFLKCLNHHADELQLRTPKIRRWKKRWMELGSIFAIVRFNNAKSQYERTFLFYSHENRINYRSLFVNLELCAIFISDAKGDKEVVDNTVATFRNDSKTPIDRLWIRQINIILNYKSNTTSIYDH